mgnify:CR=1 FL=1
MFFINKFKSIKKFYIFFFISVLLINTVFLISISEAKTIKIEEILVSEDFNLNFDKKKVFDKAFEEAFLRLTSTIITKKDKKKIDKTDLNTIKSLIDSFNVIDEQFIDDKYYANINVNFDKKNSHDFFESKNIFPSTVKKLDLLILPILTNRKEEKIIFFEENPIYENWNNYNEKYYLLNYILPTEEIDDIKFLKKNIDLIENYRFDEIISKYDLKNYIIIIVEQSSEKMNILSKLKLSDTYKILNINYNNIDIYDEKLVLKLIKDLKSIYEDEWKKLNIINTSIKVPLTISLSSKNYEKIDFFENILKNLDLVSRYSVVSFDNNNIIYKIIFNGPPDKFFDQINTSGLNLLKKNQILKIE